MGMYQLSIIWAKGKLRLNPRLMLNTSNITTPTDTLLTLLDIRPTVTLDILTPPDTPIALTSTTSTTVVFSRERLRLKPNPRLMLNSITTPTNNILTQLTLPTLAILLLITPIPTAPTLTTPTISVIGVS